MIPDMVNAPIFFFMQYEEVSHFDKVLVPLLELQDAQHLTIFFSQM